MRASLSHTYSTSLKITLWNTTSHPLSRYCNMRKLDKDKDQASSCIYPTTIPLLTHTGYIKTIWSHTVYIELKPAIHAATE